MNTKRLLLLPAAIVLSLFQQNIFTPCAHGAVTPVSYWRMGENDPGGGAGSATATVDLTGGRTMTLGGSKAYSFEVAASASARTASAVCMNFFGVGGYGTNALIPSLTNNFGIECWVNSTDTNGNKCLAYNGNSAVGGFGLYQAGAAYAGLFGGVLFVGSGPAVAGQWTHLALVRNNGTATLYVNGVASGATTPSTPYPPSGVFGVAAQPQNAAADKFTGFLDEVRVFTFAAGAFSTNDLLFTPQTPVVSTLTPSAIAATTATFNGSINPNGLATTAWFQYGTTTNYGSFSPTNNLTVTNATLSVATLIANLAPGTTYHCRMVAANSAGSTSGADQAFTTIGAPIVITLPANSLTISTATLNGTVNPNGDAAIAFFQYGTNASYGSFSTTNILAATNAAVPVTNLISGLIPGMTYHFQLIAGNSAGTSVGADLTFTTLRLPTTNVITSLANSGAGSLRDAILNSVPGDVINFATNGTIILTSGELLITNSLTIVGPGATNLIISGNNASRVFRFATGTSNSLSGISIINSHAPSGSAGADGQEGSAGGQAGSVGGNGSNGGGIYNAGALTVSSCVLTGNSGGIGGNGGSGVGGFYGRAGNGGNGGDGGGIFNSGTLILTGCTLNSNTTGQGGIGGTSTEGTTGFGAGSGGNGGDGGAIWNSGELTLTRCTLNGNYGKNGGSGGAGSITGVGGNGGSGGSIYNSGALALAGCTISGSFTGIGGTSSENTTPAVGTNGSGGGIYVYGGSCSLRNTLVAVNGHSSKNGPDIFGSVTSQGHNFIGVLDGSEGITNGVNFDLAGTSAAPLNPHLLPLGNYGGPTPTMALTFGSPAQDAGDDSILTSPLNLTTDQRGFPSIFNSHVDIGAFELMPGDVNYNGVLDSGERSALLNQLLGYYNNGAADSDVLAAVLARLNGNGTVNESELNLVLANYYANSPFLAMTNVAGIGGTNVTFALPNSTEGAYNVQYSTNLMDWFYLGPATPRYLFMDTNAPGLPQRYYRLSFP